MARSPRKSSPRVKGLGHRKMTPELAAKLLPNGPCIPVPLLIRLSEFLGSHPLKANAIALVAEVNEQLDRQLREAQGRTA